MSTAPPATRLPSYTDPLHLHSSAPFLSPASTITSDSSFWGAMSPKDSNAKKKPKKSASPTTNTNEASTNNGNLCWVVGSTPAELKSGAHMTMVRKQAMASYLNEGNKRGKKSTPPVNRSRKPSEPVSDSHSNVGGEDLFPEAPTFPMPEAQPSNDQTDQFAMVIASASPERNQRRLSPWPTTRTGPQSMSSVLPPPPIVLPIRPNMEHPYDRHPPPLLRSYGRPVDPFQTMYQTNHPQISVEVLKHHCNRYFGTRGLGQHWIPTCLAHPHTFLSTLCLASAHHDIINGKATESVATAFLRQEIIHFVSQNIRDTKESIADHNIVAVTQLIIGEVIGREEMSLGFHEEGIVKMIEQRGGLNQLGVGGHLASAISWVSLASAIFREAQPRSMYTAYSTSHSTKKYLPHFTIPESPIFCPHKTSFPTLQRSDKCQDQALKIIENIWLMIETFLHETKESRKNPTTLHNTYKTICNYEPISEICRQGNVLTEREWRYEAIRITAILLATAIIHRVPLSEALSLPVPPPPPPKPSPLYTHSIASRSSDSVISPYEWRHDTPVTEYSTSPSYSTLSTSPAIAQSGFPFTAPRASFSSGHSASNAQRPSLASIYSSSSDVIYFPQPVAPAPAPASNSPTARLRALKDALEKSNLSDSWSEMGGVLLWIGLVVGAASRKNENKVLKRYFSATAMRATIMLCFDHPEAIHATMLKMTEVVEALGEGASKEAEVARGRMREQQRARRGGREG